MMNRLVFIAMLTACQSSFSMDASAYLEANNPARKQVVAMYVAGVGQGFFWANEEAKNTAKVALYCPPNTMALNPQNYVALLDQQLTFYKDTSRFKDTMPIELVLLRALQDNFPCKS